MPERFVIEVDLDAGDVLRDGKRVSGEIRSIGSAATGSTAQVGLLTKGLNALKANVIVAGLAAIYGAFRLLGQSVRSAGIQDIANNKLEQALRNVGEGGGEAAARLREVAAELQKVSNFGDESIITAQALLLSFQEVAGSEGAEILSKNLVDTAAGLSKVNGEAVDLNTVAQALGRALTGGVGALTRYGVSLTETQKEAFAAAEGLDRVRILSEILDTNFGGLAAATVDPVKQLGNAVGDLQEEVGGPIRDQLNVLAVHFTDIAQSEGTARVVRAVGNAIASTFRGIAVALDTPRRVANFFRIELRETAADVQTFIAETAQKISGFVAGAGEVLGRLPIVGEQIAKNYTTAAQVLTRFANSAGDLAEKNRDLATEARNVRDAEDASTEARARASAAAQDLAESIKDETDATKVATKVAEAYVGVVERMTAALIKLKAERDDLATADLDELVRLNQRAAALRREIKFRQALVEVTASGPLRGTLDGPLRPTFGAENATLDLSGTDVEISNTQRAIEDLTTATEGLGEAMAGASSLAATAFGRDAAAFKAVAIAQATIAAYLAAAKELSKGGGFTLGSALSILGIGLGWAATIGSIAIPGGGGSSGGARGRSSLTAGIGATGSTGPQPLNVNSSVFVSGESRIIAVDGFAIEQKLSATQAVQRRGLGA